VISERINVIYDKKKKTEHVHRLVGFIKKISYNFLV